MKPRPKVRPGVPGQGWQHAIHRLPDRDEEGSKESGNTKDTNARSSPHVRQQLRHQGREHPLFAEDPWTFHNQHDASLRAPRSGLHGKGR